MADLGDLVEYRVLRRQLVDEALATLETLWQSLDHSDVVAVRAALAEVLPTLIGTYGESVAVLALERYETLRLESGLRTRIRFRTADPVAAERILSRMEWATSALLGDNANAATARSRLRLMLDEYTLQPGRDTIARAVALDPYGERYARVPTGSETCAFCLVLASRGASYRDASTKYHGGCDCEPVPVWRGRGRFPDDYDPDLYDQIYTSALAEADSGSLKDVLAAARRLNPGLH